MKIKKYYGDSMREALDLVKRELGSNALILSSKQVKARPALGLKNAMVYEVTAAMDMDGEPAAALFSPESTATDRARPAPGTTGRGPRPQDPFSGSDAAARAAELSPALRGELSQLRRLIYSLHAPAATKRMSASDAPSYEIFCELIANEVEEGLAYQLVERARTGLADPDGATRAQWTAAVRHLVSEMITVAPTDDARAPEDRDGGRMVAAFVGPTGVGKTTTVAKLAARYALELGRKVLLVTLDTYRIAAIEQLRTYAGIIGVPIEVVSDVAGLARALAQNRQRDVVLIDTCGCSQRDTGRMQALACHLDGLPQVQKHLVLSATTKPIDLAEIIDQFGVFGSTKLLFTKLDETSTFGPILNELVRTRKPLSYLTNGQKVPEDLSVPTARDVANLMITAA